MGAEAAAEGLDEVYLFFPLEGSDLEFYAAEALEYLLFGLGEHVVVGVHPYEAVGGYADFGVGEGSVVEYGVLLVVEEGGFEGEEQGGVGAQGFCVGGAGEGLVDELGYAAHLLVLVCVAAEVGQGGALAEADALALLVGDAQDDAVVVGVCSA